MNIALLKSYRSGLVQFWMAAFFLWVSGILSEGGSVLQAQRQPHHEGTSSPWAGSMLPSSGVPVHCIIAVIRQLKARELSFYFKNKSTTTTKIQKLYSLSELEAQTNPPWFNAQVVTWALLSTRCAWGQAGALSVTVWARHWDFPRCSVDLGQPCFFIQLLEYWLDFFVVLTLGSCALLGFSWRKM